MVEIDQSLRNRRRNHLRDNITSRSSINQERVMDNHSADIRKSHQVLRASSKNDYDGTVLDIKFEIFNTQPIIYISCYNIKIRS
jgi:hypothetical protein